MTSNPSLFWGLIASMWIGNFMLIVLNLPMIGIWVKLLTVPYRFLYPAILTFCSIGVYSVNNTVFDVFVAAACGMVGYLCWLPLPRWWPWWRCPRSRPSAKRRSRRSSAVVPEASTCLRSPGSRTARMAPARAERLTGMQRE